MISDDLAAQLHDRVTQGESLSTEEQARLESWYALQDRAENKALGLTDTEEELQTLKAQVAASLTQLMTVAKRIQEVASENESLRREITALRRQLAHLLTLQPA